MGQRILGYSLVMEAGGKYFSFPSALLKPLSAIFFISSFPFFLYISLFLLLFPLFFGGCLLFTPPLPHSSQWAPSSNSSYAMLHSASISQKGAFIDVWYWVFTSADSVFMTAAQKIPFDPLALGSLEDCIPGSQGTLTIEEAILGRLALPQITLQDSRLKHTSSLSEKESYLFCLRGRLLVWHTYKSLQRCSQGTEDSRCNLCILPLPPSSSLLSSRSELMPLSGVLTFVTIVRRDFYITWLWWPSGLSSSPTGLSLMEKEFLNHYQPQGTARRNRTRNSIFL